MDPFFMYVSIGALVLLILILVVVGVSMSQLQSVVPFPPTQNACPDYWDVKSDDPNKCGVPINSTMRNRGLIQTTDNAGVDKNAIKNVGMCETAASTNFGCGSANSLGLGSYTSGQMYQYVQLNNNPKWGTLYPGLTERCAQKNWANMLNIEWDGVSNYNGC
jgi:hypothetical protein